MTTDPSTGAGTPAGLSDSRVRTVRLPASTPATAISREGVRSVTVHEDGSTSVEVTGVLIVDGALLRSPGQLLAQWHAAANAIYEFSDATLGPDDVMPAYDRARAYMYALVWDHMLKRRAAGEPDRTALSTLQLIRTTTAAAGAAEPQTDDNRLYFATIDETLARMIDAWEQATALTWENDN